MEESDYLSKFASKVYIVHRRDEFRASKIMADRALNNPRSGRRRVGSVLLADNLLSEHELASFLKVQVSEVIFDTFTWREGLFTFWDKEPPHSTAVTL